MLAEVPIEDGVTDDLASSVFRSNRADVRRTERIFSFYTYLRTIQKIHSIRGQPALDRTSTGKQVRKGAALPSVG